MTKTPAAGKPPRHRVIADAIREDIRSGRHALGSRLPTEEELSERFRTSRPTVRTALATLAREGLIVRRTRVGSTVVATAPVAVLSQQVESVEQLLAYPASTRREPVLENSFVRASYELATTLGCEAGTEWFLISMLRYAADSPRPICWTDMYVVPQFADVTRHPKHFVIPVSVQIGELFGVRLERAHLEVFAGPVPAHMAGPLQTEAGSPALYIVRRYRGSDDQVFEVSISVHPANRYRMAFDLKREIRVMPHSRR
ncbi:MAG: GntR family transcriptional regulator [Lautropia sp.]